MAYRKVVLTQTDKSIKQTVPDAESISSVDFKFKNDYSSKKLKELYNEFDSISLDNVETFVEEGNTALSNNKVSFKTKLYLSTAIAVVLVLAFIAIYNIFVINAINQNINILTEEITISSAEYDTAYSAYLENSDPETILQRIIKTTNMSTLKNMGIQTTKVSVKEQQKVQGDTNWFNNFCNFLSHLFGG